MALKKINENPKITDTILLEITTPDVTGCFISNPYKVDRVTIYYVERNFLGNNYGEYTKTVISEDLKIKLAAAEKAVCLDDSLDNLTKLDKVRSEIVSASQSNTFFYNDRVAIKSIGSEGFPAWLSSDTDNALISLVSTDENGNVQYGHFEYEWNPQGSVREGDYFVCWTWTPLMAGEKLSAHVHFSISGDSALVSTIPSHETPAGKYDTLLERYLPEMYKYELTQGDVTPVVTDKLNKAVAKGFTFLEDMANQIIDLFDANALHESMLTYLSNTFSIKLKSNDPTLWRRQIKEAIPLFKKKGTLTGLKEAFSQAGMTLNSFTQYWQVVSPNTWTESFKVVDTHVFVLEKDEINTPTHDNFSLWLTRNDEVTELSSDYVSISQLADGSLHMTWIGDTLLNNAVDLFVGDIIKIKYEYNTGTIDSYLESIIQTLPLMDQRNEADQLYPPKNWNVRLIAEDDPFFTIVVATRHPFQDPLVFGSIRTEFAYSENIYNADEYNGSTRPSFDPCHIDKSFIDSCGACLSSSYNVDIGVEELCNDRMMEAQNILKEYTPFHARLHSINFTGEINEFVQSPSEQIDTLVTIDHVQFVLSGQANPFFTRNMPKGLGDWKVTREDLTDRLTVLSGKIGTAYNDNISFITPDYSLKDLGVIKDNHILKILSPSPNEGTYTIDDIHGSTARVSSTVSEPLNQSAFTFVLSNVLYGNSISSITQDNLVTFTDSTFDVGLAGVKTLWDVDNTPDYSGGSWKVSIPAYSATPYEIVDIQQGVLILKGDSNLPTSNTSSISYTLKNDIGDVIYTSSSGTLKIKNRGYVNFNDNSILDVNLYIKIGDYLYYDNQEYLISEIDGLNFWIDGYNDGNAVGVNVHNRRRLVSNGVGYFNYQGLRLTTFADHEAEFEIVNGANPPTLDDITDDSNFKENYMFEIADEFYKIVSIDEREVVLAGRDQAWKTLDSGGTAVAYSVIHLPKKQVNIGFTVFDHLDRDGQDPIIREVYSDVDQDTVMMALSMPKSSGVQENVSQEEGVSIIIEMRNGETLEGDL